MHGGEWHQILLFFFPVVVSGVLFIRKRSIVKLVDLFPEVVVEVLKAKVLPLFKDVEKSLLKDFHSALDMALELVIGNFR